MGRVIEIAVAVAGLLCGPVQWHAGAQVRPGAIRQYDIDSVVVTGHRLLRDIGVQQTRIDTTVLHENISSSMADILTQNSTIFIKSFGRATLSTASFRGTSPSHTQVTWNGMRLSSPMLGMVDFSMIPSYFIDQATLLHGTSSVNVTGGGLGGAVALSTRPAVHEGVGVQYIQGVGSFRTFDQYVRLTYGDRRWQTSTRVVYGSSPNRYKYRNYNKMEDMVWDDDGNLVSYRYPVERNRGGQFDDLHVLQEAYYNTGRGDRIGISAWYLNSVRGVPMLNVDYKEEAEYTNEQSEQTLRSVVSWERIAPELKLGAKAGYVYTRLGYDYLRDVGNGQWAHMVRSRSYVNTFYGMAEAEWSPAKKLMVTGNITLHQHLVKSQDKNIITQQGEEAVVGYDQGRVELSGYVSVKWKPAERLGMSAALREDMYGTRWTPVIPAVFIDYMPFPRRDIVFKASVSRNYRFPTLNDLYFLPGGNPNLKTERGFTYDGGVELTVLDKKGITLKGEATAFESRINDWIVWLPTFKGFWSPMNVKKVHAYGVELKADMTAGLGGGWVLSMDGNYSWTPSINHGDPVNWADESIGKQLVYIPRHQAAVTGRLSWQSWALTYKWNYYGERYTTSSNETAMRIGRLSPYYMSDVSIEKRFSFRPVNVSLRGVVKNLFNEEYETVLSRPMPGINYQFFIELRPNFGKGKKKAAN